MERIVILSKFAERLDELVFDKGITQKELAEITGLDRASICRYLKGNCQPLVKSIVPLADFFMCSTDFLLGIEDENNVHNFKKCPPITERLAELVNKSGLSKLGFSKAVGIADSNFYKYLDGIKDMSVESAVKIANYFDCSLDNVLGREN